MATDLPYDLNRLAQLDAVETGIRSSSQPDPDETGIMLYRTLTYEQALPDFAEEHRAELDHVFPKGTVPYGPLGEWVLVQERGQPPVRKSGLIVLNSTQAKDGSVEYIGRVMLIGPLAGYDKLNNCYQPGWPSFHLGQFVLVNRFSSNRYQETKDDGSPIYRLVHANEILATVLTIKQVVR